MRKPLGSRMIGQHNHTRDLKEAKVLLEELG